LALLTKHPVFVSDNYRFRYLEEQWRRRRPLASLW